MRQALVDAYCGELAAPPRLSASVDGTDLVFTAGGYRHGPVGFRAYSTGSRSLDQATMVWDAAGRLTGVVNGSLLGERRTGSLGGVAIDLLARPDAKRLAVIGSGRQAWTQLWAANAIRDLTEVRVYSPNAEHRQVFAARGANELGLPITPVASARDAVLDADIVILATRCANPVIDFDWLSSGVHVTTVGPKSKEAHECPDAVTHAAAVIATDSPDQARAYPGGCLTERPLTHLGGIAAGESAGRQSNEEVTLYISTGLAGSEVVAAHYLSTARR